MTSPNIYRKQCFISRAVRDGRSCISSTLLLDGFRECRFAFTHTQQARFMFIEYCTYNTNFCDQPIHCFVSKWIVVSMHMITNTVGIPRTSRLPHHTACHIGRILTQQTWNFWFHCNIVNYVCVTKSKVKKVNLYGAKECSAGDLGRFILRPN